MVKLASLTLHRAHCALGSIIALALGLTAVAAGLMPVANGAIAMHPNRPPIGIAPIVAAAGESVMASQRPHAPRSRQGATSRAPVLHPRGPIAAISRWIVLPARPGGRMASDREVARPPRGGREFLFEMMRWPRALVGEVTPRTPPTSSSCCPR